MEKVFVEDDWIVFVKMGVDWKLLLCLVLLFLMLDFYLNRRILDLDYVEYNYKLYIEEEEDFIEEKRNFDWGK